MEGLRQRIKLLGSAQAELDADGLAARQITQLTDEGDQSVGVFKRRMVRRRKDFGACFDAPVGRDLFRIFLGRENRTVAWLGTL